MKIIFTILILSLSIAPLHAQEKESVNWLTFEQLSDSLKVNPKKVLISFHADWCAYCRKMHREVFTRPAIIEQLNSDYYAVSFDAETRDSVYFDGQVFVNKQATDARRGSHELAWLFASRNGQIVLPATIVLDENFSVVHRSFEYLGPRNLVKILLRYQ